MSLLTNLILGVLHLSMAVMDILTILILLELVHSRWPMKWLRPAVRAVHPMTTFLLKSFQTQLARMNVHNISEWTMLALGLICLFIAKLVINVFASIFA